MIEIAIAVGVIGFALVAIIGILPIGMSSQKDNREETTISQDAPYFLNAIRNGEMRNYNCIFTNFVETITITDPISGKSVIYNNPFLTSGTNPYLTTDSNIIGLLSFPEWDVRYPSNTIYPQTNQVVAVIRAMSGSAVMQSGNGTNMAFRYQMTVENVPWNSIAIDATNYAYYAAATPPNPPEWTNRYIRFLELPYLTNSLHEVRLKFAWPVLPNNTVGPNRQTYRTLVSSYLWMTDNIANAPPTLWFFQPQHYTTNIYDVSRL